MKIISGQFIPRDLQKRKNILFLGERPSLYFARHPKERSKGNYNTTTTDFIFQNWIRKYFKGSVYVTDMVKTEGRAGKNLREWSKNPLFAKILLKELKTVRPKVIVAMGRKVEKIFTNDVQFSNFKNRVILIYHPSYVSRYNKFNDWDAQFKKILKLCAK